MNREEHLSKTFPLTDGTTYIQNLDKHMSYKLLAENRYGKYIIPRDIAYTFTAQTILDGYVHESSTIDYILSVGGNIIHAGTGFGDFLPALKNINKVYAYEPNKLMYESTKETIDINHITNVELNNIALGPDDTFALINTIDDQNRQMGPRTEINLYGFYENYESHPDEQIVHMSKMDTLFNEDIKIDLIHLDLEGFELKALDGAINLINRDKPIIILEIHEQPIAHNTYMEKLGYYPIKQLTHNANEQMIFVNAVYMYRNEADSIF
jgi:FkbM family methyltransferase